MSEMESWRTEENMSTKKEEAKKTTRHGWMMDDGRGEGGGGVERVKIGGNGVSLKLRGRRIDKVIYFWSQRRNI